MGSHCANICAQSPLHAPSVALYRGEGGGQITQQSFMSIARVFTGVCCAVKSNTNSYLKCKVVVLTVNYAIL